MLQVGSVERVGSRFRSSVRLVVGFRIPLAFGQEDIVEWLSVSWDGLQALSVESFKMDSRLGYKSFDVIVNDNKKVTFYKIQESPQLHLYRKDDGLLYRFPGDLGFTMLNPHVKVKEKE